MTNLASLVGRAFLGLLFVISGVAKIGGYATYAASIAAVGLPMAPFFLYGAVLIEIGGGISLISGFRARIGALLLFAFLIPTTLLFHLKPGLDAHYNLIDKSHLIHVLKNLAIMGGLLMVYANGAGKWTVGRDS